MRNLDQQTGAVAALAIGIQTTAVRQARERLHAEGDSLVAELGGGDKTHAAGRAGLGEVSRPGET